MTPTQNEKPLLLIDVDGPLNPFNASNRKAEAFGYRAYQTNPLTEDGRYWKDAFGYTLKVRLKREHGEELLKLADVFELVWATAWEHDANVWIAPKIGLPELPVIEFKKLLAKFPEPPEPGLHWKAAAILAYATAFDRPFAWLDDEVGGKEGMYFFQWHKHPFLAMNIDATTGLTANHFKELREWAEGGMYGDE